METNGADKMIASGVDEAECSETMVEIKIKTLDSQIYTLRVNKCVSTFCPFIFPDED